MLLVIVQFTMILFILSIYKDVVIFLQLMDGKHFKI